MAAEQKTQTAVFDPLVIERDIDADNLHRLDEIRPVPAIGMPRHGPAGDRRLAEELTRPQEDVRSDEALGNIQCPTVQEKLEQARVVEVRLIEIGRPAARRHLGDVRIGDAAQAVQHGRREQRPTTDEETIASERGNIGNVQARGAECVVRLGREHRRRLVHLRSSR